MSNSNQKCTLVLHSRSGYSETFSNITKDQATDLLEVSMFRNTNCIKVEILRTDNQNLNP